jgi:hypothetical protein
MVDRGEVLLQGKQSGVICMHIADLFDKVISSSKYAGDFAFDVLLGYMRENQQSGLALAEKGRKNFILVFVNGEPEGATIIDDTGMLFGDKAVYLLEHTEVFKLFLIDPKFGESLAARCKIYERSHLRKQLSVDLPAIGGNKQTLGKLCIVVKKADTLQSGMRVSIRKGRQVLASDITTVDGKVCFKLVNGMYDCVVENRSQSVSRFVVDFHERYSESVIDVGGRAEND